MAEVILMPRLSDTMTEGVIAAWHKKVGDSVKKGELLAEVETDKATMELESYKEGTLLYRGTDDGGKIVVNELLAIIGAPNEDVSTLIKRNSQPNEQTASNGTPQQTAAAPAKENTSAKESVQPATPAPTPAIPSPSNKDDTKKTDNNNTPTGVEFYDDIPVSQMRKTIARVLSESKFSAPHFYLTMSIDMDNAIESRAKLNEVSPVKISYNDMVVKVSAMALRQHPVINSSWRGETIRKNHNINIGVAVAVEEGLVVPVIRNVDQKSLSQLAIEIKEYAQLAKNKKLQPADYTGNTFTISNLGMFGIHSFTGIIYPPDACILAVSAIEKTPVVKNGEIVMGNVMKLTLSCDHRVVDGATGAAFLQTMKAFLEDPLRTLI